MTESTIARPIAEQLEQYRVELTAYCYRMLGSSEAEDAVQETFIRAWRGIDRFEGRAALRSWLYRIATNVCLDMLDSRKRRALPMDLGPAGAPIVENLRTPDQLWIEPMPDGLVVPEGDPAEVVTGPRVRPPRVRRRLAAAAAAPARGAHPLRGPALEGGRGRRAPRHDRGLGEQRLAAGACDARGERRSPRTSAASVETADEELLRRYVAAFESYDMEALTALIQEDATQSMPPFDLWLAGRDDIFTWWVGPGNGCRGLACHPGRVGERRTRVRPVQAGEDGDGYEPWALQVLEIENGKIVGLTFFLDTATIFPRFGLPLRYEDLA